MPLICHDIYFIQVVHRTLDKFDFKNKLHVLAFTKEGLLENIIQLLQPLLKDEDIPHCAKLCEIILKKAQETVENLHTKFTVSINLKKKEVEQ